MRGHVARNNAFGRTQVASKEMILQGQIFVACGHLGNVDKTDHTLIVFTNV